ncbi:MAG: carboxypeptidase regulatory-like domain-containing protein [Deltaproteobacteria bacterium]|nr:carboxypeptidase regulatory-like domain-containing protein [Deltaproteobacteria bacterium]
MTRRVLLSLALFGMLAGAAVVVVRGGEAGAGDREGSEAASFAEGRDASRRQAPAFSKVLAPQRGSIVGSVVDGAGKAVARAAVTAHGPVSRATQSGADGTWRLADLDAGEYRLDASSGLLASEPVGPVPLAGGEELRDLVLVLEVGAALSGVVRDQRDGRPIPAATVTAGASGATSDEQGRFRLTGLPGGLLTLQAFAEGYVPRSSEVELVRGRERTGADVHLERAGRVFGRVTDNQGKPVPFAEVLSARYGFASRLSSLAPVAVTAEDGAFSGNVPPGRLELLARAAGYAEARTEEFDLGASEEHEANLQLGQGGTLFGQVRDAEGAGVSQCQVQAFDTVHGRITAQGSTGPGGQYWLAGVPQAVYLVFAACPTGRAEAGGVRLAEGAQVQVDLQLGSGTIAGRVVDAAGKPVAGAAIAVRPDGSAAPESPAGTSRADGTFELGRLAGSRFAVSASAPRGRAERAGVAPGTRDLVLALGSAELVGIVVGDRGAPVPDFVVYAEPQQLESGRPRSQRFLSSIGEFRMPLAPGRYGLKVGAPGYGNATVPGVEVRSGPPGPKVRVILTQGATVRGRTIDPQGVGVPGVRVATSPNMLFAYGRAAPVASGAFALSDEKGAFTLTGVAPGERVHLFAAKEGWQQKGPAFASASSGAEVSNVEVRLAPGSRRDEGEREFAGVGMTLGNRDGVVVIHEVFEGGPAREAGIRPGDQVLKVDGAPAPGGQLNEVIARIRGEVGTTVTLTVRRDGRESVLAIPRAVVKF